MLYQHFRTINIALTFIILFVFTHNVRAYESEIDLKGKLYTYEAEDSAATNVLQNKVIFKKNTDEDCQLSRGNRWYWIKFTIKNNSNKKLPYYLVIPNGLIEYISFYIKDQKLNQILYTLHTGIAYPFAQRPVDNRQFTLPIIIESGKNIEVFVRGHINTGTLIMPVSLYNPEGYDLHLLTQNILTSFVLVFWFFSMVLGIILYSLFRERLYFYYTSYVVLLMLFWASYEGLSFQYLWPNSTFLANNSRNCYLLAGISFAIFVISIITHSGNKLTNIKKYIKILSYVFLLLTVLISLTSNEFSNICTRLVLFADINLGLLIIVIIYSILYKINERNEYGWYSFASALPIIFYVTIQLLSYYKFIYVSRTSIFMQYGFGLCSIMEVMCLVGMLIYRFDRIITHNIITQQSLLYSNSIIEDYKQGLLIEKKKKNKPSNINEKEELEMLMLKLNGVMSVKELYKIKNLTIQSVSELLGVSSHLLSRCINQTNETNFNDYINKQRIIESIKLLEDKKFAYLTMEDIGDEVGFSTKSNFYSSFKKFTNKSPKQYIRNEQSKQL